MNAKEAAKISQQVRERREKQRKADEEERLEKREALQRKERANFLIAFYNRVEELIKQAVENGEKHCIVGWLTGKNTASNIVEAEKEYEAYDYRDLIERVFKSLRKKGFVVETAVNESEHYVSYDTSDDTFSTYHTDAKISW